MKRISILAGFLFLLLAGCAIPRPADSTPAQSESKLISEARSLICQVLGHEWMESTCLVPETCRRCGEKDDYVPEHLYSLWEPEGDYLVQRCAFCSDARKKEFKKYVEAEIEELGIVDPAATYDSGVYCAIYSTDAQGRDRVSIAYLLASRAEEGYTGRLYDAFSEVPIFKYTNTEKYNPFRIMQDKIFCSSPYFESCTFHKSEYILDLSNFPNDISSSYKKSLMESLMPDRGDRYSSDEVFLSVWDVANLYVQLIPEEHRVTAQELCQGMDPNDPDMKMPPDFKRALSQFSFP